MSVTEKPIDTKAGYSTYCRAGNHATCGTVGAKCTCTCHKKNGNGTRTFECEDCGKVVPNAQGLGAHRKAAHGVAGKPAATKPARPVLIELVDEEPPPPPAPKKKPVEEILELVEGSDLEPGRWWRVAMFMSSRASKAAATRLTNLTAGGPYEWQAANDGRLFVRTKEA